ncbi:MAG: type II toxin-antitoxin system VapC family toxin [Burkholderiaceae bacterium]|jgi:predicted nucleic acid-binding protein|nr:type II toxin-antitoxin system VapC family toxin [Burkholderiaceae bacterium]
MILLDTNVLSEPLKPRPNPALLAWMNAQALETLHICTISLAEMRFGMAIMPDGKRKKNMKQWLEEHMVPLFEGRVLAFDAAPAAVYGQLRANAGAAGKAIDAVDGYIASIVFTHGLSVATRDIAPFSAAGLKVINPWGTGGPA